MKVKHPQSNPAHQQQKTQGMGLANATKQRTSWLSGGLLCALLLISVHYVVGWPALLAYWRSVPIGQLALALGLFAISYILRAARIYQLCYIQLQGHWLTVIKLSVLHQFANNILPMRLGEGVFPLLMQRYFAIRIGEGLARLIWLRVLDLMIAGLLLTLTFGYFFPALILLVLALMAGLMLGSYWVYRKRLRWRLDRLPGYARLAPMLIMLRQSAPQSLEQFSRLIGFSLLAWGTKLLALMIILQALQHLPYPVALAGVLGAELSSILPVHGLAGSGSFEAAFMLGLAPTGQLGSQALILAVNVHLFILGASTLFALLSIGIPVASPNPVAPPNPKESQHEHSP